MRILAALCLSMLLALSARAGPLIFAAASTARALDAAIAESGMDVTVSYGASGAIARQIEQGAPADLFLSANPKWMAHLVDLGLVAADTVEPLLSNTLVLIAPSGAGALMPTAAALAARLEDEQFVMADFTTAPVGRYGHAALTSLGLWQAVAPSYVPTRNTIATVAAVALGEAALGLVYASDALGVDGVEVVYDIPHESHPAILYLVAPVAGGTEPEQAAALLAFLKADAARTVFAGFGFRPAEGAP